MIYRRALDSKSSSHYNTHKVEVILLRSVPTVCIFFQIPASSPECEGVEYHFRGVSPVFPVRFSSFLHVPLPTPNLRGCVKAAATEVL